MFIRIRPPSAAAPGEPMTESEDANSDEVSSDGASESGSDDGSVMGV